MFDRVLAKLFDMVMKEIETENDKKGNIGKSG